MKISEFYNYAQEKLKYMESNILNNEINILLMDRLNLSFTQLILSKNKNLSQEKLEILKKDIDMRCKGNPLQYILGKWQFMDSNFYVGEGVLIPREDTSVLVNLAVSKTKDKEDLSVIDLCSGTGCIGITIEKISKNIKEVYAIEYSKDAFKYLLLNIENLKSKVKPINADIFEEYKNFDDLYFDLIVSNPPYIKRKDIKNLEREVLFEPALALDGGEDGLDFYRNICKFWTSKLKKGGYLAFELGIFQFEDVKNIMHRYGYNCINFERDINGIERAIIGVKK